MDCSTPGFPVLLYLPEFAQIQVHWVGDAVLTISSSAAPFSFCLQSFPASGFFSNDFALCNRWPEYWSFSFSISPSSEYSGLISFRIDWFYQFGAQPSLWSSCHICTWLLEKPWLWIYRSLSAKWCLCFLTCCLGLSFFLPRSKHLLISWPQSQSTVILQPKNIKSITASTFLTPLYLPWSDGKGCLTHK